VKKLVKSLAVVLFLLRASISFGGEIVISGSYQGKDIYVQNPFDQTTKKFCTQTVYVNDRLVFEQPKVSAYKIDLSYLSVNDLVVIRIAYSEGCKPRVVNPQVLKSAKTAFKFLSAETDHNSITWMTEGESLEGKYFVEQQTEEHDWEIIDTVNTKNESSVNSYTVAAPHDKGVNAYRIKYKGDGGEVIYSIESAFTKSDKITFYPSVATTTLTLSDTAEFVITDYFGKAVKKGEGIEIFIDDLKPGEYYLNIQNRKEKFVKK